MDTDAQAAQRQHTGFDLVPSVTAEGLRPGIHAWVTSAPMRALVEEFGSTLPLGNVESILAFLDDFSRQHWDFRDRSASPGKTEVERHHVSWTPFAPNREALVRAAARALGLVDPRPPTLPEYDHLLILGGRARANRRRSMFAAHLVRHVVRCRQVTGLGSLRELSQAAGDNESERLEEYGVPIRTNEAAMLKDAMRSAFSANDFSSSASHRTAGSEHVESATTTDGTSLIIVAAPNSPAGRRADTGTSMKYWATNVAELGPGQRILSITTSIYAPYQQAVAIGTLALPFRAHVETIGVDDTAIIDASEPPLFTGAQYLQEVRGTVLWYRSLLTPVAR